MRKFFSPAIICLVVIIAAVALFQISFKNTDNNLDRPIVTTSDDQPPNKDNYKPLDLAKFNQRYSTAYNSQESWITDAQIIALRFAGYPNLDGILPDEVIIFPTNSERVTIIILQLTHVFDDSVASIETRVDLVQNDQIWEVEWAGGRWRCRAGRGHQDWSPELCY